MLRATALAAVGLALAGCGGAHHATPAQERAWAQRVQNWLALEAFQGNFRNCESRLREKVGAAPGRDLSSVDGAVTGLCGRFQVAYRDLDRALKTNNADLYFRSQREMNRAGDEIPRVRGLVDAWSPTRTHGLPTKSGVSDVSRVEPRFGAAASAVAGFPVKVRCWSKADWPRIQSVAGTEGGGRPVVRDLGGLADPTADWIDLSPSVCAALVDVTYGGVRSGDDPAIGLTVLAHEATHMRGDTGSEAQTECYAMQRVRIVGPRLGVSAGDSERLALVYWRDVYPDDLPEYVTADCRDGGPLDLRTSKVWP